MIDGELRPVVTEFVVEMLNDPRCESVLLDTGEDAIVGSDASVLYLDVTGKRHGCTLNIVGGEYSVSVRDRDTDETIITVRGREGAWEFRELLAEIKIKLWEDK
jgi:hypothetical protein|nr:MAG TPA: hypothetical protein [Caudoviricetes sp.]